MALFVDPYPPFGDESYPATIDVHEPAQPRDRTTIAIRLLLVIPHFVLLFFLLLGWLVATVIAWFAILFTRSYPASLYSYGAGVMRWELRVEAYLLPLVDEYPHSRSTRSPTPDRRSPGPRRPWSLRRQAGRGRTSQSDSAPGRD
jgi:hypothetical protein